MWSKEAKKGKRARRAEKQQHEERMYMQLKQEERNAKLVDKEENLPTPVSSSTSAQTHILPPQPPEILKTYATLSKPLDVTKPSSNHTCNTCKTTFPDVATFRQHYKSEWHRYNLKQKQSSNGHIITEQEYNDMEEFQYG